MGINAEIRNFKIGLVDYINQSNLPMEIKSLVVHDVANMVRIEADKIVVAEQNAAKESEVRIDE